MSKRKENAFTLAEVLITLAIIGVIAAITIPTLIAKINSIVTDNQQKVFNAKIIKCMNLTKTAGDLNDTYTSTYDFLVNGLGKNLKMAKVCDKDHIRDCIPYDEIKYEDKNGNENIIDVKDITTVNKLNLKAPYMDPAAFVLADGTPVIVSYNKQCIDDPDKADTSINLCLAGIYDLNGSRKPNKYAATLDTDGKTVKAYTGDVRTFNGASIGCIGKIGNICIISNIKGGNVAGYNEMLLEIQAIDSSYVLPKILTNNKNDYWQLANDYCTKVQNGKLPTRAQLAQIAQILYNEPSIKGNQDVYGLDWSTNKNTVFTALGITDNPSRFDIWTDESHGSSGANNWLFMKSYVGVNGSDRSGISGQFAFCLDK